MRNFLALLIAALLSFASSAFAQSTGGGSNIGPINGPAGSASATTFNFGTAGTGIYGTSALVQIAAGGGQVFGCSSTGCGASGSTGLTANHFILTNTFASTTAPTITSGLGTSPVVTANNGTNWFEFTTSATGSPTTTTVIGLTAASHDWECSIRDVTTPADTAKQSGALSATSATFTWNTAPSTSDVLVGGCPSGG